MIYKGLGAALVAVTLSAATVQLPTPSKQPVQSTPEQRKAVQDGVQLHDMGDYRAAVRKFEQVLLQNPDDVTAMYELGNTLMAAKDFRKSLESAMQGAAYQSKLLPDFYSVIASDFDELGEQENAVEVYRQGMRAFPENAILPLNLAITYERTKKPDDARKLYELAAQIRPAYGSAHYRLARLYSRNGYEIPGLLAHLRFLEVTQDMRRGRDSLQMVIGRLFGGATEGAKANEVNVTVAIAGAKTDEGDFTGASMMLGLGAAFRFTEEGKKKSRPEQVLFQVDGLFDSLNNDKKLVKEKKKFAATYYAAYFRELYKAHHTEAFTYSILSLSEWPEVAVWVENNRDKVKAYRDWSEAYPWPTAPGPKSLTR